MELLLAQVRSKAVNIAVGSGVNYIGGFAIRSLVKFLSKLPEVERDGLERLKRRLTTKIKIVTPAIDLIQLIAARGNTSLDSTVSLTRSLRREINEFDENVERASEAIQSATSREEQKKAATKVKEYMIGLLDRIEEAIPLISLALTTSGANLSASLPDTVSPSRLLQASAFLLSADSTFLSRANEKHQVGPTFVLKLYTVFYGTARNPHTTTAGDITWKEEHAKCYVEVFRVPAERPKLADRHRHRVSNTPMYSYELVITEDLDDGRYHDELDQNPPDKNWKGPIKGKRRVIPLAIATRLFFSASGRLLLIEDAISPVLVLKLNKAFLGQSPYSMFTDELSASDEDDDDLTTDESEELEAFAAKVESPTNIEWLAFELWTDDVDDEVKSGSEIEEDWVEEEEETQELNGGERKPKASLGLTEASLAAAFSRLSLSSADIENLMSRRRKSSSANTQSHAAQQPTQAHSLNSLSLLEYIIRLAALQTNDQDSTLNISDERIALYLRDENRSTAREAARDVSDPIGPDRSPATSRFADSGVRSRRSRSSTPITPSNTTAPVSARQSDSAGLRRSVRIEQHRRSSPETPGLGRTIVRRPHGISEEQATKLSSAGPSTPRVGVVPGSGHQTRNDTGSLTPWELDRLRGLDNSDGSPLDGKITRRRRSGRHES
ncbi:RanGTP-binding protein-domain-containing protein [Lipomyces arxii]|uniref:RanGTP-binding protein-domain-containing protein n=1 Tax=Lipomyces arxii TaxID=56418 RepID=UPI0034CDF638